MTRMLFILLFCATFFLSYSIVCQDSFNNSVFCLDQNPIIDSSLTILRDKTTSCKEFQEETDNITKALALKVGAFLPTVQKEINTPTMISFNGGVALQKNPIFVPILRSGLCLLPTFQRFFKGASVGMMGLKRNEKTADPMLYYSNLPEIKKDDIIIVLEPMLATGGSLELAISHLKKSGATEENIFIVTIVGVRQGIDRLLKKYPAIRIILAALDFHLNEKWYIVPGLGDFGDRYFGNDSEPEFEVLQRLPVTE